MIKQNILVIFMKQCDDKAQNILVIFMKQCGDKAQNI